ncbi:hypothetical protein TIFTF001_014519 [Ficus carica]|uniref:Uncharacterized protein n=1 Tax=Ficus carica TaxID=3494 RepID=A0AA88ARC4_FICCA|nr:hypothetical protein TIFTF001_014519 [Ficus carica]
MGTLPLFTSTEMNYLAPFRTRFKTKLEVLYIRDKGFSSFFPQVIGNLKNLAVLRLARNRFTGICHKTSAEVDCFNTSLQILHCK